MAAAATPTQKELTAAGENDEGSTPSQLFSVPFCLRKTALCWFLCVTRAQFVLREDAGPCSRT
jgi:hypothetical protein